MAEHKHGSMDITAQEQMFAGFVKFWGRFAVGVMIFLAFLALVNG